MESNNLKILQKEILNIAKEVTKLCDKYNIKYSIIAGTLLGAVRHKGFIPWDDDLDIAMPRKDYDKFLKIAEKELPEPFFLQYDENEENYAYAFAKVRNKNTETYENFTEKVNIRKGIWIDIFPCDYISNNLKIAKFHFKYVPFINFVLKVRCNYKYQTNTSYLKIRYKLIKLLSYCFSKKYLKQKLKKLMLKYYNKDCNNMINYGGVYAFENEVLTKTIFNNLKKFKFEDTEFYGFKNYDSYLTKMYGDYLTPPPKEKQKVHILKFRIKKTK